MDEGELIARLKEKDEDAFIQLVNEYKKRIIGLCYSFANDYNEAEDLSQDIFINIYNKINAFRGESSLSTYIYKISISRCIDYKRKKRLKNIFGGLFTLQKDESVNFEEKQYIKECIKALPEDLKTVVVLYYYVGLSQREIGSILEVSEKAIEGKLYRAKKKLKIEFEKEGYWLCSKNGMT